MILRQDSFSAADLIQRTKASFGAKFQSQLSFFEKKTARQAGYASMWYVSYLIQPVWVANNI